MTGNPYHLIVIGAGSGGCTIAREVARRSLSVLLIDKRKRDEIGGKLTCDTLPSYVIEKLSLPEPTAEEVDMVMKRLMVFSPSRRHRFEADLDAYIVRRLVFGQSLLRYALESGAELLAETEFCEAITENGYVVGVGCRSATGEENEYRASIVCDASGYPAVVCKALPDSVYQNDVLHPDDVVYGYREVRDLIGTSDATPSHGYPGWYCYLQNGGYAWVVPEDGVRGNIGCGVPLSSEDLDPERITKEYCRSHPGIFGERVHAAGTGPTPYLPVRTCRTELVGNGFMVVGDAAYQVNPVSAFGVAGSMIAGALAAETAVAAIRNGNPSREGLWDYNVKYKRGTGSVFAFMDPLRIFTQTLSNEDVDVLIETGLMSANEVSTTWSDRTFRYSPFEMAKKFLAGFSHIRLLLKMNSVYSTCKKLEKLYQRFPDDIRDFEGWVSKRRRIYATLFRKLDLEREI